MVTYLLFKLASLVLPLLPERLSYGLATWAGDLAYLLYGPGREAVAANLRQVLGPEASPQQLQQVAREVFRTAARNYLNLFLLPHTDLERLGRQVRWHGLPWVEAALAQGRGVILVTAHLGSFDILSQLSAQRGIPIAILVEPLGNPALFRLVAGLRSSLGLRMLPATPAGLKAALKLLQAGGIVGITADRDIQRQGTRVDFFGEPASLPTGAMELALRTGAALVPCFGLRLGFRRYAVYFEPALDLPGGTRQGRDPSVVHAGVMQLARVMERYVRKYPEQWVVFHPLWPQETLGRRAGRPREPGTSPAEVPGLDTVSLP